MYEIGYHTSTFVLKLHRFRTEFIYILLTLCVAVSPLCFQYFYFCFSLVINYYLSIVSQIFYQMNTLFILGYFRSFFFFVLFYFSFFRFCRVFYHKVSMGLGYDSPSSTNTANSGLSAQSKVNSMVLQKIQALVAANPQFLTSGIPNQLLSQLLMQPIKVRFA